jgi:hypothetical protein
MKSQQIIISSWLVAVFSLLSVSAFANPIIPPHLASVEQIGESCNVEIKFFTLRGSSYQLFSSPILIDDHVPTSPENLIVAPPNASYFNRLIHCNLEGGERFYELFRKEGEQLVPIFQYHLDYPPMRSILLGDCQSDPAICDIPSSCEFTSRCDEPLSQCALIECRLPIKLQDFTAKLETNQIHFNWETVTEIDNLGVNIWCAQIEGNDFKAPIKLNSKLIPTQGNSTNGTTYSETYSIEAMGLKAGVYHCGLEDANSNGQCTLQCDHISSVTIGDGQSALADTQAAALCNKYKQKGKCLEQLLAPK